MRHEPRDKNDVVLDGPDILKKRLYTLKFY